MNCEPTTRFAASAFNVPRGHPALLGEANVVAGHTAPDAMPAAPSSSRRLRVNRCSANRSIVSTPHSTAWFHPGPN
jgi:hypothetical protein